MSQTNFMAFPDISLKSTSVSLMDDLAPISVLRGTTSNDWCGLYVTTGERSHGLFKNNKWQLLERLA